MSIRKLIEAAPTRLHAWSFGVIVGVCCGLVIAHMLLTLAGCAAKPEPAPLKGYHTFWSTTEAVE